VVLVREAIAWIEVAILARSSGDVIYGFCGSFQYERISSSDYGRRRREDSDK
jgi:hypothetical protein